MAYYTIQLSANKAVVVPVAGRIILVDDLGAAPGVDIMPNYGGRDLPNMPNRKKAFKFSEPFDSVTLKTTVDATIGIFLSKNDVSLGFADGSAVNVSGQVVVANTAAARVPVDIAGGVVNVTADNVGISNNDALAIPVRPQSITNFIHGVPTAVGAGAAVLLPHDATWRRIHIRNASTTQTVAIGGVDVTLANAALTLAPGESWVDDGAAGAGWYAISDAAGADVRVMGVK